MKKAMLLLSIFSFAVAQEVKKTGVSTRRQKLTAKEQI
jgi:hypothetical protein